MNAKELRRFLKKVNKTDTCWLWTAGKQKGYGAFYFNGGMRPAHRVIYSHYFGDIPDGKEIDHTCFNKGCVNPYHLDCVTPSVNNRRGKLNAKQVNLTYQSDKIEYCKNGHKRNIGNTYEYRNSLTCRVCQLNGVNKYQAKLKARIAS